jgi:hypothetical protein
MDGKKYSIIPTKSPVKGYIFRGLGDDKFHGSLEGMMNVTIIPENISVHEIDYSKLSDNNQKELVELFKNEKT